MTTQTGSHSRTISGYLMHLLEYPRWLIECEVDFTHCPHHGHFEEGVEACDACIFGKGCKWLSHYASGSIEDAPLTELVDALASAVEYVEGRRQSEHPRDCGCNECTWLKASRRFLRSISE